MAYKSFFTRKRARFFGYGGRGVNIPYGTLLPADDEGDILYRDIPLCSAGSQNACNFFVQDDDGHGKERGQLVSDITCILEHLDPNHQKRWDRVWGDPIAAKYKDKEHKDFWLWDRPFYDAPITDLRHILELVRGG